MGHRFNRFFVLFCFVFVFNAKFNCLLPIGGFVISENRNHQKLTRKRKTEIVLTMNFELKKILFHPKQIPESRKPETPNRVVVSLRLYNVCDTSISNPSISR